LSFIVWFGTGTVWKVGWGFPQLDSHTFVCGKVEESGGGQSPRVQQNRQWGP